MNDMIEHLIIINVSAGLRTGPALTGGEKKIGQEAKQLFPRPTSGFPQVKENTQKHWKTKKNSLVA